MMRSDSEYSVLWEEERRRTPRMAIDGLVCATIVPDNSGLLIDLGEEGMCISVADPLVASTEIHFALTFEGYRTVQGMGRVCWRSQSGKKAGVRFVGLSSDSREFIRKWLGIGHVSTSLMFLPGCSKPMHPLSGAEQQTASEDRSQATDLLRSAIASRPRAPNNGSRFKGILHGTAVCAVLVALGVMIHSHAGMLSKLAWLTPIVGTQPTSEPVQEVGSGGFMPSDGTSKALLRDWRPGQPIRNTAMFYYPDQNETSFPVEVTDASRERWLATVTNQNLTLSGTSDTIQEMRSASSGNAKSLAPSMSRPGSRLQFQGLMTGVLRNDGALVEEGDRPSSASNASNRESVPTPIVLEAKIGRDGAVKNIQLISSRDSKLAVVVVAAVGHWRYWPLYENGQAIEFATRITFDFSGPSP